jgi:hypothetical protein
MMTITQELAEILDDVDRPGDFFVSGRAEFLAPRIQGPLGFRIASAVRPTQPAARR